MGLLFLVSLYLQYNDPDPLRWMLIYGAAAAVSFLAPWKPIAKRLAMIVVVVALAWILWLSPEIAGVNSFSDLFLKMNEKGGAVEVNKANIADLLSLDLDSTLDTLLSAFISHLRKSFVDSVSVSYAGTRLFLKKLLNYGFFIRDREGKVVVYAPADVAAHAIVLNEENWYLLPGDNDI